MKNKQKQSFKQLILSFIIIIILRTMSSLNRSLDFNFNLPDNLTTLRSLDYGGECQDRSSSTAGSSKPISIRKLCKIGTSTVIIESLIELLISFYESDESRGSQIFESLCDSLSQINGISFNSSSLGIPELRPLRLQYQQAFQNLIQLTRYRLGFSNQPALLPPPPSSTSSSSILSTSVLPYYSRYNSEFQELEYIAKGGFGSVYRVRNRLDHHEYAVKKVKLKYNADISKFKEMTNEVITLAKLNQTNIVPYKTAWIEMTEHPLKNRPSSIEESSDFIVFDNSSDFPYSSSSLSNDDDDDDYDDSQFGAILYIQMQLCDQTLQSWIQERRDSIDMKTNLYLFRQLLEGVAYIHSQGILHRDLKPRNIFIRRRNEEDLLVQIGDFGLAKQDVQDNVVPPETPSTDEELGLYVRKRHTSFVGTHLYAAPEQLSNGFIDFKSDMYSLGILLYELFSHFETEMERIRSITELRESSVLHESFSESYPGIDTLILDLTNSLPSMRPSAQDLLDSRFSRNSKTILELTLENYSLQGLIQSLKTEIEDQKCVLRDRDAEIRDLKSKLQELQISCS